jgi:hypothetical protein
MFGLSKSTTGQKIVAKAKQICENGDWRKVLPKELPKVQQKERSGLSRSWNNTQKGT